MTTEGTLELAEKVNLPPGPVLVTLDVKPTKSGDDLVTVVTEIWKERAARGEKGRTKEEIDADVQALRDELEDRARRSPEKPPC